MICSELDIRKAKRTPITSKVDMHNIACWYYIQASVPTETQLINYAGIEASIYLKRYIDVLYTDPTTMFILDKHILASVGYRVGKSVLKEFENTRCEGRYLKVHRNDDRLKKAHNYNIDSLKDKEYFYLLTKQQYQSLFTTERATCALEIYKYYLFAVRIYRCIFKEIYDHITNGIELPESNTIDIRKYDTWIAELGHAPTITDVIDRLFSKSKANLLKTLYELEESSS